MSFKTANRFAEMNYVELGLSKDVSLQKPKTIDETNEPSEFFQGAYVKTFIKIVYTEKYFMISEKCPIYIFGLYLTLV